MVPHVLGPSHDHVASAISAASVLGVLSGWLPPLAALGAVIWYGILIYTWVVNKGWRPKKNA